jgi:hypothetical protein
VPLLLVDLDNPLIDRAGAFARWAREFTAARGGGDGQPVGATMPYSWIFR